MIRTINHSDIDERIVPPCCKIDRQDVKCADKPNCEVRVCYFRDKNNPITFEAKHCADICNECHLKGYTILDGATVCKKHYLAKKYGCDTALELLDKLNINFITSKADNHIILNKNYKDVLEFCTLKKIKCWESTIGEKLWLHITEVKSLK